LKSKQKETILLEEFFIVLFISKSVINPFVFEEYGNQLLHLRLRQALDSDGDLDVQLDFGVLGSTGQTAYSSKLVLQRQLV
jgi:hypothetical protein